MKFKWNSVKNIANYKKHSIWFEEAQTTWVDAFAVEFFDPENIRIISARKATRLERATYEEDR